MYDTCLCVTLTLCLCVTLCLCLYQDALTEETRLKLLATNKYKALENEVERLQSALEEEEESKQASQAKVLSLTQQVRMHKPTRVAYG